MRNWSMARKTGVVLLAVQILFLSAGFHGAECHLPVLHATRSLSQERFAPDSKLNGPISERCNACFFNQLLCHCVFPQLFEAAVTEFFNPQICAFPQSTSFAIMGCEVDRGPPIPIAFL
jgi:hypothetical protein